MSLPLDPARVQIVLDGIAAGDLRLRHIRRPESGLSDTVYVLETDRHDLILRTFPDASEAAWKPEKERIVYNLLRQQGIPAPRVLTGDFSRTLLPFAFVLSERLPGITLSQAYPDLDAEQRNAVYAELGDYLGRMHALTFDAFGDVAQDQPNGPVTVGPAQELKQGRETRDGQAGPFVSWKAMHAQIVQRHLSFLRQTEFDDLTAPLDAFFHERSFLLDDPITPRLLHMDLHGGNILVHEGRVTGLLDVEESLIGHNEYDLMRTELAHFPHGDTAIRNAFFGGYSRHIPLDNGYEPRRPFYELSRTLVALRCLVTYGDRYASDLDGEKQAVRTRVGELLRQSPPEDAGFTRREKQVRCEEHGSDDFDDPERAPCRPFLPQTQQG